MRSFLLTDDQDTMIGMRLAGIQGKQVSGKDAILAEIDRLLEDPTIGMIMVTEGIMRQAEDQIMERKMKTAETLIVQIPGADGKMDEDRISRYIRESIGLKF